MRADLKRSALWGVGLFAFGLSAGCYESTENVGGDSHFLRPCERQAQCDDLGQGYSCEDGYCQPPAAIEVADASAPDAASAISTGSGAGTEAAPGVTAAPGPASVSSEEAAPLVLLLLDTSGSMERTGPCVCEDLACANCLPACDPVAGTSQRNRWAQLLEALTGSFRDFSCEAIERTPENGATYDVGYYLPYHRPSGEQDADGVLDLYRDRLRFGVATFDGIDTYLGAERRVKVEQFNHTLSTAEVGQWSYAPERELDWSPEGVVWPVGTFRYPNEHSAGDYIMDTGIRNALAPEGALRVAIDPARAGEVHDAIQLDLLNVRPYGGTPIASALDDLYYVLQQDPDMESERGRQVPRHVVLITDGEPDADYRDLGCDCNQGDDPERCGPPPNDPALMHCPYPTAAAAARALRCGKYAFGCEGPAAAVHVVGLDVGSDETIVETFDQLALEGGTERARHASGTSELRRALMDLLDAIAP
jgi:type IV pilus assembly protein PilY1